jgi:hypothetical protein
MTARALRKPYWSQVFLVSERERQFQASSPVAETKKRLTHKRTQLQQSARTFDE